MAKKPHQLLAQSLARAKAQAIKGIVRTKDLSRLDYKRLEKEGWLTRIIRGWYLLKQPGIKDGDSTPWYSSFWDFISAYLSDRFGKNYCLSANASIDLHVGATTIPKQLLVMSKKGGSSLIHLPFNTSILLYQETKTFPQQIEQIKHINVMPLAIALHRVSPKYFLQQAKDIEIALKFVDPTALARELLTGSNLASANRIIGAYYFLGETQRAKQLESNLLAAGYKVEPINPLTIKEPLLASHPRIKSPYAARITIMWQQMRDDVLSIFPPDPGRITAAQKYLTELEKIFVYDAYNSLSIEGYEVSAELIHQIANGKWNPDHSLNDKNQINAMAAKGYRLAFNTVKKSIERIFQKENPGKVIQEDLHSWYSALFSPSVKAGILKAEQLAGYRTHPVYIRGSMHTPLPKDALMDAMEAFFDCLIHEPHASVRAVLGHFIFVFIHPYMDGNGRIGRFIMNCLFASGGFPWTIIEVVRRDEYMKTLEKASVDQDIEPFAKFVYSEMKQN
ncbi:MAG: Fic family protein [Gammaproteobacteria bacterium]